MKISDPARNTKNLTIPPGEVVVIQYEYEKLRKRCFHCQRLTHEKARCPLLKKPRVQTQSACPPGICSGFPGLLREDNEMAQRYVAHADPTERNARIRRVQQYTVEQSGESEVRPLRITTNMDKGKGHVFAYEDQSAISDGRHKSKGRAGPAMSAPIDSNLYEVVISSVPSIPTITTEKSPTVFEFGAVHVALQSGNSSSAGKKARRRPTTWKRNVRNRLSFLPASKNH
ncbi:hypothetical protein V5N11_005954 [Cardamine amara subsp. amara]|uniref:Zinc knuckle CX2CX4HX4C domain-containing protein n=1 Tax=Cardamine amara subsp. amara TaxID=228776 RepID=A0ABD0Z213_CARAN